LVAAPGGGGGGGDSGDDGGEIIVQSSDIDGIWRAYFTKSEESQEGAEKYLILSAHDDELICLIPHEGGIIENLVDLDGSNISFAWKDGATDMDLEGTVDKESLLGTWSDANDGSGTWRALKGLTIEDTQTTLYETGDIVMALDQDGGSGTATFYGTPPAEGEDPTYTRITIETEDGDMDITLNEEERITDLSVGDIQITLTYSQDSTFDYSLYANGVLVYSESGLAVAEENTQSSQLASNDSFIGVQEKQTTQAFVAAEKDAPSLYLKIDFLKAKYMDFHIDLHRSNLDIGNLPKSGFKLFLFKNKEFQSLMNTIAALAIFRNVRLADADKECIGLFKENCIKHYKKVKALFDDYIFFLNIAAGGMVEQIHDEYPGGEETHCADGVDDDGDGYTDCADPDCRNFVNLQGKACQPFKEIQCDDDFDNDGNEYMDCDDSHCAKMDVCQDGDSGTTEKYPIEYKGLLYLEFPLQLSGFAMRECTGIEDLKILLYEDGTLVAHTVSFGMIETNTDYESRCGLAEAGEIRNGCCWITRSDPYVGPAYTANGTYGNGTFTLIDRLPFWPDVTGTYDEDKIEASSIKPWYNFSFVLDRVE